MTDTPPRRRHSPAVYRRRRLALLLVVLLIVAAVVLAFWRPWEGAASDGPAQPASSDAAASPSSSPSDAGGDAPEPSTSASEPSPSQDATAEEVEACSARSVQVSAVTDKDSYGAGELPQLSISLTNAGAEACLLNVGTATQKLTVSSGPDVWWRSTDCQSESSDQVVQIDPGQTVSSVTPITWDRTRSSVDSCDGERPAAPAGYFNLAVEIGGLAAQQERQFVLR